MSLPRTLLRLEGLTVFLIASVEFYIMDGAWWLYLVLLVAPDLSMIGYLYNNRIGSYMYDLVHTYVAPLALLYYGLLTDQTYVLYALPWLAHLGLDRFLVYGLKYPARFNDDHLQRV